MDKFYKKKNFGTAQMAEMMPGERVTVLCNNYAEVTSLRSSAVQFVKIKQPEGIVRFSAASKQNEDGTYNVVFEAMTE